MNNHDEVKEENHYGHLKWRHIFFDENGCINLVMIMKLFQHNLIQFVIFHDKVNYEESIILDTHFLHQLYGLMKYSNDNFLKQRFKNLIIINPKIDDLNSFINENKDNIINKFGWTLNVCSYSDPQRNAKSDRSLSICPIKL